MREEIGQLEVFIERGCDACQRAIHLAEEVDRDYPGLAVRIVDVGDPDAQRDDVFAVPTFILNDRVLSLGNPRRSQLDREIASLLEGPGFG